MGIEQYKQDYDSTYPMAYFYRDGAGSGNGYNHWTGSIQPYMKSLQIFVCPSHAAGGFAPTNGSTFDGSGIDIQVPKLSYICNEVIMPRKKSSLITSLNTVNEASIEGVSEVISVAEIANSLNQLAGTSAGGGAADNKSHRPTSGLSEGSATTEYNSEDGTDTIYATPADTAIDAIKNPSVGKPHIMYSSLDRPLRRRQLSVR